MGFPFRVLRGECLKPIDSKEKLEIESCSAQSVPSLSNLAIRSLGGTKSDDPSFVTFSTKAVIAFFDAVSFQEGRGSAAHPADAMTDVSKRTALVFIKCVAAWASHPLARTTRE